MASQNRKLLILLHGYGSDGKDLEPIGSYIKKNIPSLDFISPNGLEICAVNPSGYQWFHLSQERNYEFSEDVQNSVETLYHGFITEQIELRGIKIEDVILCGFSQGGMLALAIGLSLPAKPLMVVSLSGLLLDKIDIVGKNQPNLLLLHGEDDSVLPIDNYYKTIDSLRQNDIKHTSKSFNNLAHSISIEELDYLIDYLRDFLQED
jgi:phospholipase/carboxylesterase